MRKYKSTQMHQDQDTWFCALVAVRYCMGRQSYAPSLVQDWIVRYWNVIPASHRAMLLRDVSEEIAMAERNGVLLGSKFDHEGWISFRDWMRKDISNDTP